MEHEKQKCNLTAGQAVAIGAGALLTAAVVVGGVCLGKKLYRKAQEENWGEQLREKMEGMASSAREEAIDVAEEVKSGAKTVAKKAKKTAKVASKVEEATEEAEEEE